LFHSGREPTYEALPVVIKDLRDRGYRFVTIAELAKESSLDKTAWLK